MKLHMKYRCYMYFARYGPQPRTYPMRDVRTDIQTSVTLYVQIHGRDIKNVIFALKNKKYYGNIIIPINNRLNEYIP